MGRTPGRRDGTGFREGIVRLPLAKEGLPFIVVTTTLALAAAWWARHGGWGLRGAAPIALGAVALLVAWFFRDPERTAPPGEDRVVSPADGRVLSVGPVSVRDDDFLAQHIGDDFLAEHVGDDFLAEHVGDDSLAEHIGGDFLAGHVGGGGDPTMMRVTIFLSIFDVHVQRAPLAGRIGGYARRAGRYLPAWESEASRENEQASLGIETAGGPVVVRQIAGLVARRIVTYPRVGDRVARGERIGLIRFGSRVDLFVPAEWQVEVGPGDMVRGGETVVATALRSGGSPR